MTALKDITGMRFGKLVAIELAGTKDFGSGNLRAEWRCRCDCGKEVLRRSSTLLASLKKGRPVSTSCGCGRPSKRLDLSGNRFGKLVVIGFFSSENDIVKWRCRCDCGQETLVRTVNLRTGHTTSCGCYRVEASSIAGKSNATHGLSKKGPYRIWWLMLARCELPSHKSFKNYGARGISVCAEGLDRVNFVTWAMANGYRSGLTIERNDNNGNYEPGNCRWATRKEQAQNKRSNKFITAFGRTQTIAQWADETGIPYTTVRVRFFTLGWTAERAVSEPVRESLGLNQAASEESLREGSR